MKLLASLASLALVAADTPANCRVSDLWGTWQFTLGTRGDINTVANGANNINLGPVSGNGTFSFAPDNQAQNEQTGSTGTVTTIWNQGFEFEIDNQFWWMNFWFNSSSYDCSRTAVGYVSDGVGIHWARVQGVRVSQSVYSDELESEVEFVKPSLFPEFMKTQKYSTQNNEFIQQLNQQADGFWTAKSYESHGKYTLEEMNLRAGTRKITRQYPKVVDVKARVEQAKQVHAKIMSEDVVGLPTNLDWRNYNGESYVTPPQDQQSCGSCYSFGATGMMEGRVRVMTNNAQKPQFSQQDIITCGQDRGMDQGCNGGFPFLMGKYVQSFGVVESSCVPYNYKSTTCQPTTNCTRWYGNNYRYLGGYYGATQGDGGARMMEELLNGPIEVSFDVIDGFSSYSGGVYVMPSSSLRDEFNPFIDVNHAVTLVGYGVCDGVNPECGSAGRGTPYWIVRNSWGQSWGQGGYFLILRGVDELAIESIPVAVEMIPQF